MPSRGRLVRRIREFSPVDRYGLTLVLLVITYVQALLVPDGHAGTASVIVLQLATVYLVFSVSASPRVRRAAGIPLLVAAVLAVLAGVFGTSYGNQPILDVLYVANVVLYALAPVVILRHVFRRPVVDGQAFLAALSAYVIIGMLFAFVYRAIEVFGATSFFDAPGTGSMPNFLFFSFVTVTTTGYGNLVPASTTGQTLAVLEAVSGQFFIAAVVAKIVTAWRPRWARPTGWDFAEDPSGGAAPGEAAGPDPTD
jgi:hypothetical protein